MAPWHHQRSQPLRRLTVINLRNTHATRRAATGNSHVRIKLYAHIFLDITNDKYFLPMYSRSNLIYHLTIVMKYNPLERFSYRIIMPLFSKDLTRCARGISLKGNRGESWTRVTLCGLRCPLLTSARLKGLPWPRGQGHTAISPVT